MRSGHVETPQVLPKPKGLEMVPPCKTIVVPVRLVFIVDRCVNAVSRVYFTLLCFTSRKSLQVQYKYHL